MLLQQRHNKVT